VLAHIVAPRYSRTGRWCRRRVAIRCYVVRRVEVDAFSTTS
jgi:hypothetical protein